MVPTFDGQAEPISLIPVGDTWRYYLATNAPPVEWNLTNFDDSTWMEQPSGFSSGRAFDSLEATLWPPATNYSSAFLRTRFNLADTSSVQWMILRVDYNDGFVAYLNGQEIARRGLTNDPVAWNDLPTFHPGGAAEEIDVSAYGELLRNGENLLAIQVHNATNDTPLIPAPFSIRLLPELLANFNRGPYLQNLTTNSVQIVWRTPVSTDSAIEYGPDQALGSEITNGTLGTIHTLTVTNLNSGTQYWYRVRSSSSNATVTSPLASFRTFRTNGAVVFHVIGDSGGQVVQQSTGIVPQYRLAQLMTERPADLVLHCGDVVYPDFYPGREDTHLLNVYRNLMRSVPMFATMGNHEFDPVSHGQTYLDTFVLPTNVITGTEHFYSFDHGDAHFVSLFIPQLNWGGVPSDCGCLPQYALTNGSLQYSWLTNDLASTAKPWKILFFHVPINDSGNHRYDDYNQNGIDDRLELQELLYPLARRYGVQLIFNGHDHIYERFNPTNGLYSIVTGGGGGPLPREFFSRAPNSTKRDAGSCQFYLAWHFLTVSIADDTLRVEAVGTNGMVFDTMTIRRTAPPPPILHSAAWHTPVIETNAANDGHGNLTNQTFDFVGAPLLTASGDFSNLGRVFVNNDATNLYLGFEQAMLNEDNNIFLFVASPRLAGVSNLVGLGDGLTGTSEGADGLDLLENLSFTNFNPCVAIVLGDEYADANDRMFSRPDLSLTNVGQGAFRLNAQFTDVSGSRLQQFNRSPQILEPPFQLLYPEQNANFIKVAIPFDQLGGLLPGDTIQIAAVVGGSKFDTNQQTRQLDSSYLGSFLNGSGQSNVILGGVSVCLASDPLDPASLRLSLTPLTGGTNRLSWQSVPNARYQLEISSNLSQGFTNHPNSFFPYTAPGTNAFFDDDSAFVKPVRFYRLRRVP